MTRPLAYMVFRVVEHESFEILGSFADKGRAELFASGERLKVSQPDVHILVDECFDEQTIYGQ